MSITSPDSSQINLSLAITDIKLNCDSSQNIISGLMLSSELKGVVYNPALYFKDTAQITQRYLDLVMLTNGWRKYNWQQIIIGKYPPQKYLRDSSYLYFSGEIKNPSKSLKKAMADTAHKHLIIIALRPLNDTLSNFITLPVDSEGRFAKPGLLIFDSLQVSYQFSDKKMNLRSLDMDFIPSKLDQPVNIDLRAYTKLSNYQGTQYDMSQLNSGGRIQDGVQLKTVEIRAKAKTRAELLEEKYTTSIFKGVYGYNVDVEDDKKAEISLNILDYLQLKVPGLKIRQTGSAFDPPFLEWSGIRSYPPGVGYVPPQIYLNEFAVSPDFIVRVPVSDIAYVKAFVPPFGIDRGGAIAVYTKSDKDYYGRHAPSVIRQQVIVGYNVIKEFYSPPFRKEDNSSVEMSTLYWNPMILRSAKETQSKIHFHNTTGTNGYRIIIEGFTKNGRLIHLEQEVKK